jgi:hypothetical protein
MEYIILDTYPVIDGVQQSNFVNVLTQNLTTIVVTISNAEMTTYSIPINNSDPVTSVNEYFQNLE